LSPVRRERSRRRRRRHRRGGGGGRGSGGGGRHRRHRGRCLLSTLTVRCRAVIRRIVIVLGEVLLPVG